MKAASLKEIKSQLSALEINELGDICLRMARFKKENKELLTYLLFEAQDESSYIAMVKEEIGELFGSLPTGNTYYVKKSLRKVLRFLNRQVKYSGVPQTEIELRIFFCLQIRHARIPLHTGTVLYNLYQQQIKKIQALISKLPEDVQTDFEGDVKRLSATPR
jgi:hypothetical protein